VVIELKPIAERDDLSAKAVARRWRELAGDIPDAVKLTFNADAFSAGEPINYQISGKNVERMQQAAAELRAELSRYDGVFDIADSFRSGKQEIKLALLPEARNLGLTLNDLARQVRNGFYGVEAQRIQRGQDEVRVMVRFPETERTSIGNLEDMYIRTPDGSEVPFYSVARFDIGRGFSSIRRADRQRVVNVTADVDRSRITEGQVLEELQAEVLPSILRDYPDVTYTFEGAQRVQRQAIGGLLLWSAVALFVIYALLAVPLRSYGQPLLIMSVIPFGVVGAIFGHLFMKVANQLLAGADFQLSFMSITGIVALTGVVVNASLVLVYQVNNRLGDGLPLPEAVTDASLSRFRPIVLTSVTTFVGLAPLLTERSVQAQFLIPMATSLGFGVLFAGAITLFVLPAGRLILDDLHRLPERLRARARRPARAPAPGRATEGEGEVYGTGR